MLVDAPWVEILTAILAGGAAGQITVLLLGDKRIRRRNYENWLREARFQASMELLDLVSAYHTRSDFDEWPEEVRTASQRVHLLHPKGQAPDPLANEMREIFFLILNRKVGKVKDLREWNTKMREHNRELRKQLAISVHANIGKGFS